MSTDNQTTFMDNTQYVYLIQEREFINSNQPIYKIGKTKQINNLRFNSYPKGSRLLSQLCCKDCDETERQIISLFDKKYKRHIEIGREFYEGEYRNMILDIIDIIDYRKELEDMKESQLQNEIEELKKEIILLKCEITNFTEKKTVLKEQMTNKLIENIVTEIIENKEPKNTIVEEKKEKINKITKKEYKFSCEKCCYYTNRKYCFENHKNSNTHEQKETNEFEENFECKICNKMYKSYMGLWKHKKTCQLERETQSTKEKENLSNTIKELLFENKK